jgi:hypothetical protein
MLQHRHGHHEGALSGEFALAALALAHGFADSTTELSIQTTPTVLASVTVTPKVTGKFHVTCTVNVTNDGEVTNGVIIGVGHQPAIVDYIQNSFITVLGGDVVNDALTVEYGSGPLSGVVFPVGAPVTIRLFATAQSVGSLTIDTHDAQITVEELPN